MKLSLQTVTKVLYAFGFLFLAYLALFFRGLPEKEIGEVGTDYFVFRAIPADSKIYKSTKPYIVNEQADFVGLANQPILRSALKDTRQKVFIIYGREGFEPHKEPFEKQQLQALLNAGAHPPKTEPPIELKATSFMTSFKMRLAERPGTFAGAVFCLLGTFVFFKKQSTLQAQAAILQELIAQAGDDPFIGTTILEYRLIKSLGKGGQGAVYMAVPDQLLGTERADENAVAIKICIPDTPDSFGTKARFQIEVDALKELKDHPNIVGYIEDGLTEGDVPEKRLPFLVLEYIEGETLEDLVCKRETQIIQRNGAQEPEQVTTYFKLPPQKIVEYLGPIAAALQAAHDRKIFHRDLKPLNVRIASDGRPVLLDFGLSKMENNSITRTGIAMGTPGYIPAEQVMDTKRAGHKADIFALGAMIFHMISGRSFHESHDVMGIINSTLMDQKAFDLAAEIPDLNPAISKVIHKMMALQESDRYDSIAEAFEEFQKAVENSAGA
jgi:serine/threonine protein kinase